MIKRSSAMLILVQTLCGCSFVAGLLHMDAVGIIAWSPDQELISAEQVSSVSITFSSPMDRVLAEEAFSLSRDNQPVHGNFSWQDGKTMLVFVPEAPFRDGCRFSLQVTESAEDLYGNSLSERFVFNFATAAELVPPIIVLHEPADGAKLSDLRTPVRVVFSETIEPSSFYPGFSIFPSVHGGFTWDADGAAVEFTPLVDYQNGERYEVILDREISDESGNRLGEEFRFEFSMDGIPQPTLERVTTLRDGMPLVPLESGGGIDPSLEIEKDERFLFTFGQVPNEEQKRDLFTVNPPTPFELAWDGETRVCEFAFEEDLSWNRVYTIEVLGLTYIFVVNGDTSRPITVTALTYCSDLNAPSGSEKYLLLQFADNVDFSGAVTPAFDFHLQHAPGAGVDIGSFLQALDITVVPACVSISCADIELSPLAVDPHMLPGPDQSVVRLHCTVFEDPTVSGTVTFRLDAELHDSAGNHLAEDFVLLVNNN